MHRMKTVKVRVELPVYEQLVAMRRAEGMPSVPALLLKQCGLLSEEVVATEIVRRALARAKERVGEPAYRLSDLFGKAIWRRFPKGARLLAGKMFAERVASAVEGIRTSGKTSSGHQLYVTP